VGFIFPQVCMSVWDLILFYSLCPESEQRHIHCDAPDIVTHLEMGQSLVSLHSRVMWSPR
jgi:hypothetical protein